MPAFKHSKHAIDLNRRDRKDRLITRNRKTANFKISFTDQVESEKKPLVQVHCVESYKKYNADILP